MRTVLLPVSVLFLLVALLSGCAQDARWDEVARVASPDGHLEAVLSESSGGATTPFVYQVHIVEAGGAVSGEPAAELVGATRNVSAYGADLVWMTAHRLDIRYLDATSTRRDDGVIGALGPGFELVLAPGHVNPSAPAGGMHYNLERVGNASR